MIKAILSICVLFVICEAQRYVASRQLIDEKPEPYQFAYNNADEYGTQWQRQEVADGSGTVRGSYGYKDATGIYRTVNYIADDINGFRASVSSNEPGVVDSAPAAVTYNTPK